MRPVRAIAPLVVLLVVAALPALALARPDDRPTEPFKPADGAIVKDATRGLDVDFSCPAYHQDVYDSSLVATGVGYTVTLSRLPDVDENGVLTPAGTVDVRDGAPLDKVAGHCGAERNGRGESLLPLEPGTYWWQSSRPCATYVCPGGREVSFVSKVEVRITVCSRLRGQARALVRSLARARRDLRRAPRSARRRARVTDLSSRLRLVRQRRDVVYQCAR